MTVASYCSVNTCPIITGNVLKLSRAAVLRANFFVYTHTYIYIYFKNTGLPVG